MKLSKYFLAVLALISCTSFASVKVDNVFLYLPDHAMKERIVSQPKFMKYIGDIKNGLELAFKEAKVSGPISLGLVVSVRESNESKVWFHLLEGELSQSEQQIIAKAIEKLSAPDVKNGIVPFAFGLRVGNAKVVVSEIPIPQEWRRYADGKSEITQVIGKAWKDKVLTKK